MQAIVFLIGYAIGLCIMACLLGAVIFFIANVGFAAAMTAKTAFFIALAISFTLSVLKATFS